MERAVRDPVDLFVSSGYGPQDSLSQRCAHEALDLIVQRRGRKPQDPLMECRARDPVDGFARHAGF
eukprot:6748553-Alexandrium_andersonii.AAC.1